MFFDKIREIKSRLRRASDEIAPNDPEKLYSLPVERSEGGEWYLEGAGVEGPRKTWGVRRYVSAVTAAAAVLVVISLSFGKAPSYATVYFDVNPSVSIKVNDRDRVVSAQAGNVDGEAILEGMDMKDVDLDVAINALIGSMVKNGYLTEARHFILLSVDDSDADKAELLRLRISNDIDDSLTSMLGGGSVLDQVIVTDDSIMEMADEYGITPGKAALLKKLLDNNPDLNYEELAGLPMDELYDQLKSSGIDLRDYADYTGIDLDEPDDAFEEKDSEVYSDLDKADRYEMEGDRQELNGNIYDLDEDRYNRDDDDDWDDDRDYDDDFHWRDDDFGAETDDELASDIETLSDDGE